MWLAQVGSERLDEIADPEKAILRGAEFYRAKGYSEGGINQRLQTIEMRKELTDEWIARGIERDKDYAILTNEMTKAWSGLTVQEYKACQRLKERKTAGQYDEHRAGPEYACGSYDDGAFKARADGNIRGK